MPVAIFSVPEIFVHGALLCYVVGLLVRDELRLRFMILLGTGFYILYYFQAADMPLWEAIFGSTAIGTANLYVMIRILFERSTLGMSPDHLEIYQHFETLNPGLFRRLMRYAKVWTAEEDTELCGEGQSNDKLYMIRSGTVILQRGGQQSELGPGKFIGELSFLLDTTASATVIAPPGTVVIEWEGAMIKQLMRRSPEFSNAINAHFNFDIARKLSASWPLKPA